MNKDIRAAMLGDHEAAKRLTDAGSSNRRSGESTKNTLIGLRNSIRICRMHSPYGKLRSSRTTPRSRSLCIA